MVDDEVDIVRNIDLGGEKSLRRDAGNECQMDRPNLKGRQKKR